MRPVAASPELQQMVKVLKIIVGGLTVGVVAFLGYAAYVQLGPTPPDPAPEATMMTYILVVLALTQPVIFTVLRLVVTRQAIDIYSAKDVGPFRQKYSVAVIAGAAGTEAAGLMAGIAYLLEGQTPALGVGALCVVLLLLQFPSRSKVDGLIDGRP